MPARLCLPCALVALTTFLSQTLAQHPKTPAKAPPAAADKKAESKKAESKEAPAVPPFVVARSINLAGKTLHYRVTTGMMPIRSPEGEVEAHIFYMAYTVDSPPEGSRRPLMFSFNGGPGSSSVWLHLGALGPRRVKMLPDGSMPPPPTELVDNEYTWLERTDLVFIDPVGTGYSRPVKPELGKKFWSVQGDIDSVGQFIRQYLSEYSRWTSPLFLVGESYGTTRAAGLSGHLIDQGIALTGVVLVSSVLDFRTIIPSRGNDVPYVLFLPSYTATAWYHKKLPGDLQQDLPKTLREVEQWTVDRYMTALTKGDGMTPAERQEIIDRLSRYTGISKSFVDQANLRLDQPHFCKELLRNEKRTVGRYDSRLKGIDEKAIDGTPDYDPSEAAVRSAFTMAFNNYVRGELAYKSDLEYRILAGIRQWEWGSAMQGFPNVTDALRRALTKNPYMKVHVASGHYDLATPYFATRYTIDHLNLDPTVQGRVTTSEYEAGHMMYIESESLAKLKKEVGGFLENALKRPATAPPKTK
jgi:carboxypeptidase C (cathepsin A)